MVLSMYTYVHADRRVHSECVNARWECEDAKNDKIFENSSKCNASNHMSYVNCLPAHPLTCKVGAAADKCASCLRDKHIQASDGRADF